MYVRKPTRLRKNSGESAAEHYLRHFTGLPSALSGTAMEKERYLNSMSAETLRTVAVPSNRPPLIFLP